MSEEITFQAEKVSIEQGYTSNVKVTVTVDTEDIISELTVADIVYYSDTVEILEEIGLTKILDEFDKDEILDYFSEQEIKDYLEKVYD